MLKSSLYLALVFVAAALLVAVLLTLPEVFENDRADDLHDDLGVGLALVQSEVDTRQLDDTLALFQLALDPRVAELVKPEPVEPPKEETKKATPPAAKKDDKEEAPAEPTGPPPAKEAIDQLAKDTGADVIGVVDGEGRIILSTAEDLPEGTEMGLVPAIEGALGGQSEATDGVWMRPSDKGAYLIGAIDLRHEGAIAGAAFMGRKVDDTLATELAAALPDAKSGTSYELLFVTDKVIVASSAPKDLEPKGTKVAETLDATSISLIEQPTVRDTDGMPSAVDRVAGSDLAVLLVATRPAVVVDPRALVEAIIAKPPEEHDPIQLGIIGGAALVLLLIALILLKLEHGAPGRRFAKQVVELERNRHEFELDDRKFKGALRKAVTRLNAVIADLRKSKEPPKMVASFIIQEPDATTPMRGNQDAIVLPQKKGARKRPVIVETSRSREQDDAKAVTTEHAFGPGLAAAKPLDPDSFSSPGMMVPVPDQPGDEWAMPSPEPPPPGGFEPAPLRIPDGGYQPENTENDDMGFDLDDPTNAAMAESTPPPQAPPTPEPELRPRSDAKEKRITRPAPALANFMSAASVDIEAEDENDATISMKSDQYDRVRGDSTVDNFDPAERESTVDMDPDLDSLFAPPNATASQTHKLLEKLRERTPANTPSAAERRALENNATVPLTPGIIGRMTQTKGGYTDDAPTKVVANSDQGAAQQQPELTPRSLLGALKERAAVPPGRRPVTGSPLEPTHVKAMQGGQADAEEAAEYRRLYEEFVSTKQQCGEPVDGLTLDRFIRRLQRNRDKLTEQYTCRSVRFKVYVKDGKAALKATPIK